MKVVNVIYRQNALVSICLIILAGISNIAKAKNDPDLFVISYNSHDDPRETLFFGSIDMNQKENAQQTSKIQTLSIGGGDHLWVPDEEISESKRGWMYRFRRVIKTVADEYERRDGKDFVVFVGDATDGFVTKSSNQETLTELLHRFLHDFAARNYKIVFSSQIYCCNPWELRYFGRKAWDKHYAEEVGYIPSMFKHINAGFYMGYASAIITMAEEMHIWNTTYHERDTYLPSLTSEAGLSLEMSDLDVDDDEWQLSVWYMNDQKRDLPIATLDYQQNLFGVTGTFRTQQQDDGFMVFSRSDFREMYGSFPQLFNPNEDIDELVECPYHYNPSKMEWTSTLSGGHPLVFHFAGNDWLCACPVLKAEGYRNVPKKLRTICENEFAKWYDRVQDSIQAIAHGPSDTDRMMLHKDGKFSYSKQSNINPADRMVENDKSFKILTDRNLKENHRELIFSWKVPSPYGTNNDSTPVRGNIFSSIRSSAKNFLCGILPFFC